MCTSVWMPSTTVSTIFPTASMSPAIVTQPTITFATSTAATNPAENNLRPIPEAEPIFTSTACTATEVMHMPLITPSPSVRTRTPLARIPTPNIRVPQSSPHTISSPFNYYNAMSPSLSSGSSPAPPSPADSLYSSVNSDLSRDFNLHDADTFPARNNHVSTPRDNSFMKSLSASLLSTPVTSDYPTHEKNSSVVAPRACDNKNTTRQKKINDPLEACMISLSNSIQGKLEAKPVPIQIAKTPDQVFGDMVAAELSHMSDEDKADTKTLVVDILFARAK